jgi:hypothetical protein
MRISTTRSVKIARPPEEVFRFITDLESPARTFHGYGPIPAVLRTEVARGDPRRPGASLRVHNADGSVVTREITVVEAPSRYGYRLASGFKPPFSRLVRAGDAEWTLRADGDHTRLSWTYGFELRSLLAYPLTALLVVFLFGGAMRACLAETRRCLER